VPDADSLFPELTPETAKGHNSGRISMTPEVMARASAARAEREQNAMRQALDTLHADATGGQDLVWRELQPGAEVPIVATAIGDVAYVLKYYVMFALPVNDVAGMTWDRLRGQYPHISGHLIRGGSAGRETRHKLAKTYDHAVSQARERAKASRSRVVDRVAKPSDRGMGAL
jgi:hypothetical protein